MSAWAWPARWRSRTRLTSHPAADWLSDWSPDGSKIAFWSYRAATRDVWVMNADGSNQTNLSNTYDMELGPVWSPDGSKIAYDRADEIYVMNADGSGQINLTNDPAMDGLCGWSPDGSKIAFVSQRDFDGDIYVSEEHEIYVMNADGSDARRLTNNYAWEGCPAWQP